MRAVLLYAIWSAALFAQDTIYTIDTFAGTTWTGDGRPATSAVLIQPQGIAVDNAGNVYVSDAGDHRIRRIGTNGIIQTIAGTGIAGYSGDGEAATKARLRSPYGITVDAAGNVFIADLGNACVRRISSDGIIRTVAGGGDQLPVPGGSLIATRAQLKQPRDVAVDRSGNLFIADFEAHLVYQVTPDGMLTVVAGTGQSGTTLSGAPASQTSLSYPSALAVDPSGALYIGDSGNQCVRKIQGGWMTTVQDGNGRWVAAGTISGLACDQTGTLYVAGIGNLITVVFPNGESTRLTISGKAVAQRNAIELYTVSGRNVYKLLGGTSVVFAGATDGQSAGDGFNRSEWRFTQPSSMTRDEFGYLYIADTLNGRVRRLTPDGELQTVTTRIQEPIALALDSRARLHVFDRATKAVYRVESNGSVQRFVDVSNRSLSAGAMVFDRADNLFLADAANNVIRRISPDGAMTVVAGGGTQTSDGLALLARLVAPAGLAFDSAGDLWFTEAGFGKLRRLSGGRIATVARLDLMEPRGLRVEADGRFLIADAWTHRVVRVSSDSEWTPLAGTGDAGFAGDGDLALGAMLNRPLDVLPEPDGSILILDSGNNRIRRLRPSEIAVNPPVQPPITPPAAITMPSIEVLHGATLKREPIAPGQIVYITGESLPAKPRVTLDNVPATVLAESATKLTVVTPRETRPGVVEVAVWQDGAPKAKAPVDVSPAAPGILTVDGGTGQALATNQDGGRNGTQAPAERGSIVSLWITGEGGGTPIVMAEIGGSPADVVWSGAAPNQPGLYQVNVRTPGGFSPSGAVPVVLIVGGVRTQAGVTIVSR